jgi:hypothetical protein
MHTITFGGASILDNYLARADHAVDWILPMPRQIDLELRECKAFKNGCVLVTYRVKR